MVSVRGYLATDPDPGESSAVNRMATNDGWTPHRGPMAGRDIATANSRSQFAQAMLAPLRCRSLVSSGLQAAVSREKEDLGQGESDIGR